MSPRRRAWATPEAGGRQSYGSDALGASGLLMPLTFFMAPNDPEAGHGGRDPVGGHPGRAGRRRAAAFNLDRALAGRAD